MMKAIIVNPTRRKKKTGRASLILPKEKPKSRKFFLVNSKKIKGTMNSTTKP
jgi:hypothetical protein